MKEVMRSSNTSFRESLTQNYQLNPSIIRLVDCIDYFYPIILFYDNQAVVKYNHLFRPELTTWIIRQAASRNISPMKTKHLHHRHTFFYKNEHFSAKP